LGKQPHIEAGDFTTMGLLFKGVNRTQPKTQVVLMAFTLLATQWAGIGYAQVGPLPPPEKPHKEAPSAAKIKEKLSTLFIPQKKDEPQLEEVEVKRGAGMPGQFDTIKIKQKKKDGDETTTAAETTDTTETETSSDQAEETALKATPQPTRSAEAPSAPKHPARPKLIQQAPLNNPNVADPTPSADNPPIATPSLDNESNPLGLANARKRLNLTAKLIDEKKFHEAHEMLTPLKEWLVQSTEAHISLYKALNNVPSARAQAELEKQVALDFARMRDKAFLQMGEINIGQSKKQEAIPLLIEVIKSQPRGDIGIKAYEILQQIGFTQQLQLIE